MKKQLFIKLCLLLTLFSGLSAYAQLNNFTLVVTPTHQTCLGNGSLTFTVTGTQPGSTMAYEVFLMPANTSVATTNTNSVNNLPAGDYRVVATQSLGANSGTQEEFVTILDQSEPLTYTIVPRHVRCPGDGQLTINVDTGTAVSYEIISGPETRPVQTTNMFENLPVGTYEVRVIDNCSNAVVVTVQLVQTQTSVIIDPPVIPPGPLPDCFTITTDHFFATIDGHDIFFPLTFEYTVFPPGGGAPIIVTNTVATGNNIENHVFTDIPFYHDQEYTYNLEVTDACGNVYTRNGNIINEKFDFDAIPGTESCENYFLTLVPRIYVAPYTVNFVSAPAGFNPAGFNPDYPTHGAGPAVYGADDNPLPYGEYTIEITDACGHTETHTTTILYDADEAAQSIIDPLNCLGVIIITITDSSTGGLRDSATVILTDAPQAYLDAGNGPLPEDVSGFIIPGNGFVQQDLPLGTYTYVVTDVCGEEYTIVHTIEPAAEDLVLDESQRPGCSVGDGSIRLGSLINPLATVIITEAPAGFAVPADVSFNISPVDGDFYMNSLPAGTYKFETVDNCGNVREKTTMIQGYQVTLNDVEIIANCGSFDIDLHHTSNGSSFQSFWLQKYNDAEGTWEHPQTGVNYTEGTLPAPGNSVFLTNNTTNINLAYTGTFRVIKVFHVFSNGTVANFRCFQELESFDFDGAPMIEGFYGFPCNNNTSEVIVDANGVEPLTYAIVDNNGDVVVDNGTSNVFTGLAPGEYDFEVTDACGSSLNFSRNVNALDPIAIEAVGFCEGMDSSLSVPFFDFLDYEWTKVGNPTVLPTDPTTPNMLDFPNFQAADAGEYQVVISSDNPGSCINQTLTYTITPNTLPNAGNNNNISVCNDGTPIDVATLLSMPHDAGGTWADASGSGAFTGTTFNPAGVAQGTYQFTYTVTSACGVEDVATISVRLKDIPDAPVLDPVAGACEGDNVQLLANTVTDGTYAWTGPNGFTSTDEDPLLTNTTTADSGNYTLIITVNGCASPASTVAVTVGETPDSGDDNNAIVCNDGQSIDLSDYLSADANAGGTWEDTSGTGALTGSSFDTNGVVAGTYQFTYKTTGCGPDDEAIITITLNDRPTAPVVATVTPVCEGQNVQLSANTVVTDGTYVWTGPDGFASTEQNPLLTNTTVLNSGDYSLTVTVNGCASPASTVAVVVNPVPQFTFGGNTSICEGQSTVITVVPDNFDANDGTITYTWTVDGAVNPDLTSRAIEISVPGMYGVTVDNGFCTNTHEIEITRNTNVFTVTLEAGCLDFDYVISIANINEIPGATVDWSGPEGYSSTNEAANITGLAGGQYSVIVTNADGCSAEASVTVDNTNCFIPRGISPNDDEYNQSFDLTNLEVRDLMIYNRYGEKVYEKENYRNEWYGQSEKGELPTGTYFYVVTLSEGKQVTGWVYLQREVN